MQRNILFVSHANPQDNDFTIWLTSRLQLLGYDVWIDKNALLGGEKFWEEIDQVIRNKAAKFLLVYSTNICKENSPGKLKDGIYKEYSLAESICKQYDLKDFIILMNIDGSEYNLFIGADRLNQIGFYENWAKGLRQITEKLKKDQVHKNDSYIDEGFGSWYENQYIITSGITSKYELYYSNWWPIKDLPQQFYIYQFKTEEQARAIYEEDNNYPISKITNCLSSFESYLSFQVNFNNNLIDITPQNIFKVKTSDIFLGFESKVFPNHRDSENHFKSLLKRIFHLIMKNRRMFWYEMANRRLAYFYTPANLKSLKVKFDYPYRKNNKFKTKNLIGNYLSLGKWHYAVSVKPILYPILAFSLKNHLVFTDDGFQVWKNKHGEVDKDRIQTHRRSKASSSKFFNEQWRDMFLAFLNGLKNKDGQIEIQLSSNFNLSMPTIPEFFWAEFGYYDPKDKTRQGLLVETEVEIDDLEDVLKE